MSHDDRGPSAWSFARWAVFITLPLILSAAALPWVMARVRPAHGAPAAGAASATGAASAEAPQEPRKPEGPTTAEIEAARATAVEAARIQERNLSHAVFIAPTGGTTTPDGEHVAPFVGFGLSIETSPAGATASVGGSEVGRTPIVTTVDCAPGEEVVLAVGKRGFKPARRTVRCRADQLLTVSVALQPDRTGR